MQWNFHFILFEEKNTHKLYCQRFFCNKINTKISGYFVTKKLFLVTSMTDPSHNIAICPFNVWLALGNMSAVCWDNMIFYIAIHTTHTQCANESYTWRTVVILDVMMLYTVLEKHYNSYSILCFFIFQTLNICFIE